MDDDDWGPIPAEVLEIYFNDLDERVEFLAHLYNNAKKKEALTLCCVYIESLAQRLYVTEKKGASKEKFVRVLCEFGEQSELCLVHPPSLVEAMIGCGSTDVARIIVPKIGEQLCTREDLLTAAAPSLTSDQYTTLEKSVWHGTVAAQMYRHFRNPLVHRMYSSGGVILGGRTFPGFSVLYPALGKVAGKWKEVLAGSAQGKGPVEAPRTLPNPTTRADG